jgi:L-seryl-tRNA(Ser) seleniumtransferase
MADNQSLLRELPAVDRLLREPVLEELQGRLPRRLVLQAAQETISGLRDRITGSKDPGALPDPINLSPTFLAHEAALLAEKKAGLKLKPLINATGIIIHTNLGRAPLAAPAVEALTAIAENYNNLEYSLESGRRGSRQEHIEELLCELSGAEAALVVNNNAAAVFLALNATASGREVVVSRGQLVEIGGSFRIPEIMAASGARLREVGTTNKTYLRDYESVVGENTAAFLKVHTSNYHLIGFTAEVETGELSALARKHNLLMIEDLGSGVFLDLQKYNLPAEPRVQDSVRAGADLVTFSGDKMLGGPQCGIIVGRKDLVAYLRTNQLARTLRVDKFTVAALEATLRLYLDQETAVREIPIWRMLTMDEKILRERAAVLAARFTEIFGAETVSLIEDVSKVGGGALPTAELPTTLVAVKLQDQNPEELAEKLRRGDPPVILRLQQGSLLFDPRTIFEAQEELLIEAVRTAWQD